MINSNLNVELLRALVENRNRTQQLNSSVDTSAFDEMFLQLLSGDDPYASTLLPNDTANSFLFQKMGASQLNATSIVPAPSIGPTSYVRNEEIDPIIEEKAAKYGLDPNLIRAVIKQESGFKQEAISHAGAIGLMQLMPQTAKGLGVNPHDPVDNIEGGVKFLRGLIDRYEGDVDVALAAYNGGPGRLQRLGISNSEELAMKKHLLPGETQAYYGKVLSHYEEF